MAPRLYCIRVRSCEGRRTGEGACRTWAHAFLLDPLPSSTSKLPLQSTATTRVLHGSSESLHPRVKPERRRSVSGVTSLSRPSSSEESGPPRSVPSSLTHEAEPTSRRAGTCSSPFAPPKSAFSHSPSVLNSPHLAGEVCQGRARQEEGEPEEARAARHRVQEGSRSSVREAPGVRVRSRVFVVGRGANYRSRKNRVKEHKASEKKLLAEIELARSELAGLLGQQLVRRGVAFLHAHGS